MPEDHTILGGKVHIYKRPDSNLWQCSTYFAGKNRRTSTKEESLSKAKEVAEDYATNGLPRATNVQPLRFDKTVCAFYGEANQGASAWNKDEICPLPDRDKLDPDFHQGDFTCCGGGAGSSMTNASIPPGLEIRVDGGHYWSVDRGTLQADSYRLHTYCGPEPAPGPGCNVKVKIVGHYRMLSSTTAAGQ